MDKIIEVIESVLLPSLWSLVRNPFDGVVKFFMGACLLVTVLPALLFIFLSIYGPFIAARFAWRFYRDRSTHW